ncbi:MAG: histidine kinase dimerization/phospho-acceptor domain-containing protein, partial [Planctomycetota bacterium]
MKKRSHPESKTSSEIRLIAGLLEEVVPKHRISDDLMNSFLQAYRDGEDISSFLLDEVAHLFRETDSELTQASQGVENLHQRIQELEQIRNDLKSSLQELTVLEEMAFDEWGGHHEIDGVLSGFFDLLKRNIPLDAIRIFFINEETRAFEEAAALFLTNAQREETEERLVEGTFAWAIRENGPVVIPLPPEKAMGSTLIVAPFTIGRQPLGVVCIFSPLADADYTPHIFQIFRGIIRRTSISIANAQRYQRLEKESEQVSAMKDYLSLIVDNMIQGVMVVSGEDVITVFNRTAELIFGSERDEMVGFFIDEVLSPELNQVIRELLDRTRREGSVVDYEFNYDRGEGVSFRLGFTTALLQTDSGITGGVVFTIRDLFTANELVRLRQREHFQREAITRFRDDLRDAEERLHRSEKLASIGEMAAGVAHEINNPLGSIAGFLQLILMDSGESDPNRKYMEAMQGEVNRMKRIVEDMLEFSRQKKTLETEFLPVDLHLVLKDTLRLMEPQTKMYRVRIETHFADELLQIRGLSDRLKQVFINMILNASQSMDKE